MTGAVGGCWQERWELSQGKGLVTGSLGLSTYGLGWDGMGWMCLHEALALPK